jgi:transcriptional regulator with XRE-family HTH domain
MVVAPSFRAFRYGLPKIWHRNPRPVDYPAGNGQPARASANLVGMTVLTARPRPVVGALLRQWRLRRRLSQLELSVRADISTRHLSFLETGRSAPSREMVLQLAERLEVPLRDRNQLLLAAGFAPAYGQTPLDAPAMASVRAAVRQVLTGHEPYPAVVVDRYWDIVDLNASVGVLTGRISPALLEGPTANVLRASLHPDGMAPHIVNLGEWRGHLLSRLHRQVSFSGDARLADLEQELLGYPGDRSEPDVDVPGPGALMVPLRVRTDRGELSFFSTVSTFGTPLDITVAELCIESFYPSDEFTASAMRSPGAA